MSAISSFCRTCMDNVIDNNGVAVNSCNIFETGGLADKLMLCSNIEIQPYDEYPPRVCNKCYIKIHVFCGFQEMCRESLEKFRKMLGKQTKTDSYVPKILGSNAIVGASKDHLTNTIDLESYSKDDFSDHEMMFGYHSIDRPYDSDETASNDPLSGTEDCVLVEAISIAKSEAMEMNYRDHDYSHLSEAAVVRSVIGGGDKSEDDQGDDSDEVIDDGDDRCLDNNSIHAVEKTPVCLTPISTRLSIKILENVSPDADNKNKNGSSKTEAKCVSNEEYINESFSEINVVASHAHSEIIDLNKTVKENTFHDKISSENGKKIIINKKKLKNVGFDNKEKCTLKNLSEDKEANQAQMTNVDCENEKGCTFEDLSNVEEDGNKLLEHVPEEEANETNTNSDTVLSDRKSKTDKGLSCDMCPQTFIFEHRLNAHKRRHNGLKGYPCPRENCTRAYNRLIDLRQHVNGHNGIPRQMYKCEFNNCGQEFTYKSSLRCHLLKYHNHGPALPVHKYVCETCGKVYQNTRVLQVHQYIHVDESLWPFKCDIEGCSKSFRSQKFYKIHKNRHYGIKPFACTYCEKRFCSSANLHVHINFHTLEKKWTCSFCPLVCYTPANLRLHIRKKHENNPDAKNFPCRFCNKILSSCSSRKYHELRHTGERSFDCEECCRSFKRACDLRMHKQTHMPRGSPKVPSGGRKVGEVVKNFYCSVCNKALANAINLRQHEMKHTVGKQFECDICGVRFSYRRNLHRHQQQNLCRKPKTTKDKYPAEEGSIEVSIVDKNVHINLEDL